MYNLYYHISWRRGEAICYYLGPRYMNNISKTFFASYHPNVYVMHAMRMFLFLLRQCQMFLFVSIFPTVSYFLFMCLHIPTGLCDCYGHSRGIPLRSERLDKDKLSIYYVFWTGIILSGPKQPSTTLILGMIKQNKLPHEEARSWHFISFR